MSRLQQELQRLYGSQADARLGLDLDARGLVDVQGRVRAMVLEFWPGRPIGPRSQPSGAAFRPI